MPVCGWGGEGGREGQGLESFQENEGRAHGGLGRPAFVQRAWARSKERSLRLPKHVFVRNKSDVGEDGVKSGRGFLRER